MTLWHISCQAPLSIEFSRQEYWSGLPFPFPKDLLNPGIKPTSPVLQAGSLPSEPSGKLHKFKTHLKTVNSYINIWQFQFFKIYLCEAHSSFLISSLSFLPFFFIIISSFLGFLLLSFLLSSILPSCNFSIQQIFLDQPWSYNIY